MQRLTNIFKKGHVVKFLSSVFTFSWKKCIFRICFVQICLIGTAAKIVVQGTLSIIY